MCLAGLPSANSKIVYRNQLDVRCRPNSEAQAAHFSVGFGETTYHLLLEKPGGDSN